MTHNEIKFAKRMAMLAGREAKKLGLKPHQFNGAYIENSYVFEISFKGIHSGTVCQGEA